MSKKRLSIVDIARELKISVTTVSFIVNGKGKEKRISDKLIERVLTFIKENNYKPNELAKSLRTGKTKIIAFMVEDISNQFFSNIAKLIEELAYQKGYRLLYCSTDNNSEKAKELLKVFRDRQVDGYIITPTEGIEKEIQELFSDELPVVLFDRYLPSVEASYVGIDNYRSAYDGTGYLIDKGYKNIAFITLNSGQTQMTDRLNGYLAKVKESDLKPVVKKIDFQINASGFSADLSSMLEQEANVDAVFFATNYMGVKGLEVIRNLDLRIPEDLAVLAFDDHDLFRLHSPSITSINQPTELISENLINTVLAHIDDTDGSIGVRKIILNTKLIERNSV